MNTDEYSIYSQINFPHFQQTAVLEFMTQELSFFSPQQLANYMGVSKATIYRAIDRGDLTAVRLHKNAKSGSLRIPLSSVRAFTGAVSTPALEDAMAARQDVLGTLERRHKAVNHV